jgi:hypothetical protein
MELEAKRKLLLRLVYVQYTYIYLHIISKRFRETTRKRTFRKAKRNGDKEKVLTPKKMESR